MNRQDLTAALARVSDPSFDSVELFHASHPRWPLAPKTSSTVSKTGKKRVHIAVFDSSYNPPTRAHFAISLTSFPPPGLSTPSIEIKHHDVTQRPAPVENDPYTARLLLLSARNVDKTLKPGDATFAQRIEMMHLQALDMQDRAVDKTPDGHTDESRANVAVAALNHPTFVGKSDILLRWFRERRLVDLGAGADVDVEIRLTFLIGTDTLTRLFVPKYYEPSPRLGSTMSEHLAKFFIADGSDIVVAHRGASPQARAEEESFFQRSEECRSWVQQGKLRFALGNEITPDEREMSSTRVRRAVASADWDELRNLVGERVREYIMNEGLYRS